MKKKIYRGFFLLLCIFVTGSVIAMYYLVKTTHQMDKREFHDKGLRGVEPQTWIRFQEFFNDVIIDSNFLDPYDVDFLLRSLN